jgi:hypothetical protein
MIINFDNKTTFFITLYIGMLIVYLNNTQPKVLINY